MNVLGDHDGFTLECTVFDRDDGTVDEELGENVDGTNDLYYVDFVGREDESKQVVNVSKHIDEYAYEINAELTPTDDTDSWSLMQVIANRLEKTDLELINEIGTERYYIVSPHDTGGSA